MGAVHFSIDPQLVERLKELLPLTVFVETGTYRGDTIRQARPFFDKLYSTESSEVYHQSARERFAADDSVELHLADSKDFLRRLAPTLRDHSVLYWLDAHWCQESEASDSGDPQCPLLGELAAIGRLNARSAVLIDDARYFLAPPPEPNDPAQWPRFDSVIDALRELSPEHEVAVSNDVIVFSPKAIGDELRRFFQRSEIDWLAIMHRAEECGQLLEAAGVDRSSQIATIQALRQGLQDSEADRSARLAAIDQLNRQLAECEADRAARLEVIETLESQLRSSEDDRAARLEVIETLQEQLRTSEADRSARLEVIEALQEQLRLSEANRSDQQETIRTLQATVLEWESDRAANIARRLSTRFQSLRSR